MEPTQKKIILKTQSNRTFQIDAHEVIHNRSKYYADRDPDTIYDEEYEYLLDDESEVFDWLFNNMDWYECKTLIELDVSKEKLSTLNITDSEMVD